MSADRRVERILEVLGAAGDPPERQAQLHALATRLVELVDGDPADENLKVAATVLGEFADAAVVFSPWRDRPKLTVYGSARTPEASALYETASALSAQMRERGWITVSGGGPGIMEAAARGAGREHTLGVNIDLPFEQSSNPYVDADSRLVEMKYFFTRKVALTRESLAFAIFPGGLGTMDETFEMLTLLHTGKNPPAPVVLVDVPGGGYWERWMDFVQRAMVEEGYLGVDDLCLVRICHGVSAAVDEIERFFSNYRRFEREGRRARLVLRRGPDETARARLEARFGVFAGGEGMRVEADESLSIDFDGRNYVALRQLIDEVNALD